MLSLYQKTELEMIIENLYKRNDILLPSDLTFNKLKKVFNVEVHFLENAPNRAIWDDDDAVIFLNPKLDEKEMRKIFFHELGHPFLHVGSQEQQSTLFRSLQEAQANQFLIYSAIPFFMLESLDLPMHGQAATILIEEIFNIPNEIAAKRMTLIQQRITKRRYDIELTEKIKSKYTKAQTQLSTETHRLLDQLNRQVKSKELEVRF